MHFGFPELPLDSDIWDIFVMHFGSFGKAGIQSIRKPPEMAGNINYFYLRQQRDLYHYEFQQIEAQLNRSEVELLM